MQDRPTCLLQGEMRLSIVIPVYNDEANIKANLTRILDTMKMLAIDFEIIVIDDGSTDNTWQEVDSIKDNRISLYMEPRNQGKGWAFLNGCKHAQGEYIALMDSDLQITPWELIAFFRIMHLYDADVAIGSKRHPYSNVRYTLARWLVSNAYNLMCRLLFGISLRDTQCGLKLFKRSALEKVITKILIKRFAFDIELITALKEHNIRIADAPVNISRQYNQGSVQLGNICQTFKDTLAVWWRKRKGWYRCVNS